MKRCVDQLRLQVDGTRDALLHDHRPDGLTRMGSSGRPSGRHQEIMDVVTHGKNLLFAVLLFQDHPLPISAQLPA